MAENRRDLEAIFFAARQKPPQERAAFLDQVCGEDLVLRERAEQLPLGGPHGRRLEASPVRSTCLGKGRRDPSRRQESNRQEKSAKK
jgi:hypothetical protein